MDDVDCVVSIWMCPRCGVYTWSSGLISQWIDHMTCEVSWAYITRQLAHAIITRTYRREGQTHRDEYSTRI
jgi:hypothetical protein